jgi:hypothetical protein
MRLLLLAFHDMALGDGFTDLLFHETANQSEVLRAGMWRNSTIPCEQ